jgi:DNA processing protein
MLIYDFALLCFLVVFISRGWLAITAIPYFPTSGQQTIYQYNMALQRKLKALCALHKLCFSRITPNERQNMESENHNNNINNIATSASRAPRRATRERLELLLTLLHVCGSHMQITYRLAQQFGCMAELLCANEAVLLGLGATLEMVEMLQRLQQRVVDAALEWEARSEQRHIIVLDDVAYPTMLKEINAPPLLLFVQGDRAVLHRAQLAIVGSRNPSAPGLENAYAFARQLVHAGLVVTSGFALGIDAAAHRGALSAQGATVAVMGAGLHHIYPQRHAPLAQEIVANGGVLLSEFPLDLPPLAGNFPQRNRIISGLSVGTLIVEATLRSGSLITARLAAEQGREVFAIPNSIRNQLAQGCHALIRQGAKLVENAGDIIEELLPLVTAQLERTALRPNIDGDMQQQVGRQRVEFQSTEVQQDGLSQCSAVKNKSKNILSYNLSTQARKLLRCIDHDATAVDVIVARSNLTIAEIMSMLLPLELQGYIRKVDGGYVRCG